MRLNVNQPRGRARGPLPLSCGFNAPKASITPHHRPELAVHGKYFHEFPVSCGPTTNVRVTRVVDIDGIDNAVFLVAASVPLGINQNIQIDIPSESVGIQSRNKPAYLLLKEGG
ncbi:MAG: hypothetical protein FWF50_01700, partial [Defluviitaleaceae bacterium]|nr:hypothetical protein [Defluviitaleaceae bacterium]